MAKQRPTAVTISGDDIMFWVDHERALRYVQNVGGRIEYIPELIDEEDDEDL